VRRRRADACARRARLSAGLVRGLAALPRALTPLAIVAAVLGVIVPSGALSARSDVLLAALVLATALGISFGDLARLRDHCRPVLVLSVMPLIVLGAAGWALGRPFAQPVRDGVLATGLSSAEVASVGLVALAGADATIALGALTGSLVAAAVLGPVAIAALGAPGAGQASTLHLLGRFGLVVLVPLAAGIAIRSVAGIARWLSAPGRDGARDGTAALIVAVLVYAALSGTNGAHHLAGAILASALFLLVAGILALGWQQATRPAAAATPGAFGIAMRDFAVAAALGTQAFGTAAGTVPGVYGVMMLIAGAIAASRLSARTD
jgi:predicted Na+-dependent transporter